MGNILASTDWETELETKTLMNVGRAQRDYIWKQCAYHMDEHEAKFHFKRDHKALQGKSFFI